MYLLIYLFACLWADFIHGNFKDGRIRRRHFPPLKYIHPLCFQGSAEGTSPLGSSPTPPPSCIPGVGVGWRGGCSMPSGGTGTGREMGTLPLWLDPSPLWPGLAPTLGALAGRTHTTVSETCLLQIALQARLRSKVISCCDGEPLRALQ